LAEELTEYVKAHFSEVDAKYGFVPASILRGQGWQFQGDELIGGPLAAL
jgi:hypothetical protein